MTAKIVFAAVALVTFILTVLISKKLIPALASRKMGQKILDIGPRWHKSKEGTPTMGGLAFIAASFVAGAGASVSVASVSTAVPPQPTNAVKSISAARNNVKILIFIIPLQKEFYL